MTPAPPSSPFPGGSRPGGGGPPGEPPRTPATSGFIGRYQVLEKIGEGGMGSLYLARDPAIDRLVAIKLLRRGFDTEALRERFAREARAAGRLRHPNIVTIFDVGEHDGDPFIAMEFLAGETLGELIRHGAGLSLSRRLKLLEELCDGLAYAHRTGLVHRDIKPANLMVDAEGVLKILDFGIVRVGDSGMTQAGVLVGTINYMSPEQVVGAGVDHRSDIFAVGLVAYELLSGRQAFPGTMKDGLLRRIPNAEFEPLSSLVPGLDSEVVAIVEHALQKDPADRYQELARMRNDLARVRQRIEQEEERRAVEAASASAETALISEAPTELAMPMEPQRRAGIDPIADAERALAEGNYRFALTMAGRAAALNPQDRDPGSIVARAEQALLERGRTDEERQSSTPGGGLYRSGARPSSGAPASSPSSPPASGAASGTMAGQRANYLAIAVAIVALIVAGFAVWSQMDRPPSGTTAPAGDAADLPARTGEAPAAAVAKPPDESAVAGTAAGAGTGAPVERERGENANRPAQADTPERSSEASPRGSARRPAPPADAPVRRTPSAVQDDRSGRSGRQEKPAEKDAVDRGSAERPATPAPPLPGAGATNPPVNLPGAVRPNPPAPPPRPAPTPEPPKTEPATKTEAAPRAEPPRTDPTAEARSAVTVVLQRYEAAWEALDFEALSRVWVMPDPRGVRDQMRQYREYAMDVSVESIAVSADARSATAVCTIRYRFQGVGGRQDHTQKQTFRFEIRGENWMIVGAVS